eukprot:4345454-Lingulodinium_polyedra.AAC.1
MSQSDNQLESVWQTESVNQTISPPLSQSANYWLIDCLTDRQSDELATSITKSVSQSVIRQIVSQSINQSISPS